jgi:hypothetical protein
VSGIFLSTLPCCPSLWLGYNDFFAINRPSFLTLVSKDSKSCVIFSSRESID